MKQHKGRYNKVQQLIKASTIEHATLKEGLKSAALVLQLHPMRRSCLVTVLQDLMN